MIAGIIEVKKGVSRKEGKSGQKDGKPVND